MPNMPNYAGTSGGYRMRAGRPKGSQGLRRLATIEAAKKGGIMPLDYMLKVMRNSKAEPNRRDAMACAAAPYVHTRLQAVQHSIDPLDLTKLNDQALEALGRFLEIAATDESGAGSDGTPPASSSTH